MDEGKLKEALKFIWGSLLFCDFVRDDAPAKAVAEAIAERIALTIKAVRESEP
jgi:hypothetical protein